MMSKLLFDNAMFNKLLDLDVRMGVKLSCSAPLLPVPIRIDFNGQQCSSTNHFSSGKLLPRTAHCGDQKVSLLRKRVRLKENEDFSTAQCTYMDWIAAI